MANQPEWLNTKRPAHLSVRQPRAPKEKTEPSNVSFSGILWMTFALTISVLVFAT